MKRLLMTLRSRKGRVDVSAPALPRTRRVPREILLFFLIVGLFGLALGMSDQILANYFKEVYQVDAATRGMIEFPRELPGILCLFLLSAGAFLGDLRMAIIAQVLALAGIMVLGFATPVFGVMLIFLFLNSLGHHAIIPLNDSIGISLVKDGRVGRRMGQYNGLRTAATMVAGLLIFIGFRTGVFSFSGKVLLPFVISGVLFGVVLLLYVALHRHVGPRPIRRQRMKLLFRKEYRYYYFLSVLQGAHKQIMLVFGPWVLIELLGKGADTLAILGVIGAGIGIFFMPMLGRGIDRFGTRPLLAAGGAILMGVYLLYGFLSAGFSAGSLPTEGLPVILIFILFSINKMALEFRMVNVVYLQSIARDPSEITPTLSTGMGMDHVVSIALAALGGWLWTAIGPQYVFFMLAGLSLLNILVAYRIQPPERPVPEEIS